MNIWLYNYIYPSYNNRNTMTILSRPSFINTFVQGVPYLSSSKITVLISFCLFKPQLIQLSKIQGNFIANGKQNAPLPKLSIY